MGTDTFWGAHNCHSCHTWCILYSKFVFFVDSQYRLIDQKSVMFSYSVISLNQLLHNSKTLLIFSSPSETVSKYISLRISCIIFKVS